MIDSDNNLPKLRFPGFTDDWEQRKLGDISDVTKLAGFEFTKYVRYQESGKIIALRGLNVKNGNLVLDDVKYIDDSDFSKLNRSKLYKNDILLTYVGTVGELAIVPEDNKYFLAPNVARIRLQGHVSPIFVCQMMNDSNFYNRIILPLIATSSQPALSMENVRKFQLLMPDYQEQQKMGLFFKQLDNLITLHQRKLSDVKKLKSGLLQKMFPKNGENTPEVRFPEFTNAWEQRKLGELADIVRGASPRPIQDSKWFDKDSGIGWLRISDVTEQNGRIHHLEQHISKLGQEKTRVLSKPHLLLSIAATVGKPLVNYVKTGVHDGFLIFLNPSFEKEFMFQWLEMFRPKWNKYGQPGSQVNLNSELVKNQEISLPSIKEQQTIGAFFQQLDNLITLHQRKLEHLQQQKKALLQQMFI